MDSKIILEDLLRRFPEKLFLTDVDIAPLINRTPKAQANLRSRKKFPLPLTYLSSEPTVSLYDLADFLARNPSEFYQEAKQGQDKTENTVKKAVVKKLKAKKTLTDGEVWHPKRPSFESVILKKE